jgi:hypothetical protein
MSRADKLKADALERERIQKARESGAKTLVKFNSPEVEVAVKIVQKEPKTVKKVVKSLKKEKK